MAAIPIISVMAFVDWRAQMHNAKVDAEADVNEQASRTLSSVSRILTRALLKMDSTARFKVTLRLYHGWTKGFQPTVNRTAISAVIAGMDFSLLSTSPNVVISDDVGFGDVLLNALPERLRGGRVHLPGTLRDDEEGRLREKMVDTALASDLLTSAVTYPKEWSVVLAEDDDIVPPLFVAEAWKSGGEGKVILVRKRTLGKQNLLNLDGLLLKDVWR